MIKMNREKKLLLNTIVLSIGTFFPKVIAFITLPILTAKLTKPEYGIYDLVLTLVALLLPAVTLQIQSAAFRFLIDAREDETKKKVIITNSIVFSIGTSLVTLILLFIFLYKIAILERTIILLYLFFDILFLIFGQISRGIGDNKSYSIASIINSVMSLITIVSFLIIFKFGLIGALVSLTLSSFFSTLFLFFKINLREYFSIKYYSKNEIKKLIKYSWPMVPNNLSMWILTLSDRLIISFFLGLEANAIYAVANKIPNLFKIFQNTFNSAWQENASIFVKDKDSSLYYTKMFDTIYRLMVTLIAIVIALTPILFFILIKGNYDEAYKQMPILYLGVFTCGIATFIGGIYIAHLKTKDVGISTFIAAIINIAIDFLLIKKVGIYAGSISTLVSYSFLALYRMINVKKFQKIDYNYTNIFLGLALIVMMSIISYYRIIYAYLINIVATIIIIFIFDLDLIKKTLSVIIHKMKKKKTI